MIATGSGFVSGRRVGPDLAVEAWKGIPFAEAPTGPLRWRPPSPPRPWSGVRECLDFGPICPQPRALLWPLKAPHSEDCLHLNVWAPADRSDGAVPVMVWLHGGGFSTGAGGSLLYDGEGLARQGVVVVTFNYRLGPFGFLAHPALSAESPEGVSGNYGLLDQLAVLRWVRENIANFGGDPGCVTIFGESAGAQSVCRLAVSPRATGLFHRVIAQSGAVRGPNRRLRTSVNGLEAMETIGERVARALGAGPSNAADVLRQATPEALLAAADPAQGLFGSKTRFGPIVDGAMIPDDPELLFAKGGYIQVPYLIGTNADEGTIFLPEGSPAAFIAEQFPGHAKEVSSLYDTASDPSALNRLVTDRWFRAPARALARTVGRHAGSAWLYRFSRVSPAARKKNLGAFHAAEVPYIFNRVGNTLAYDDTDRALAARMSAAWVRFAKSGDPNGNELPEWRGVDATSDHLMEFAEDIRADAPADDASADFWDRLAVEK